MPERLTTKNREMNKLICILFALLVVTVSQAQDDDELAGLLDEPVVYAQKTFYSSRIVNSHTTESIEKKVLDFRINHRFGDVSEGYDNFFGLDNAAMRLSFDHGITDKITLGIGRSTFQKTVDGFAKYKFLSQNRGKREHANQCGVHRRYHDEHRKSATRAAPIISVPGIGYLAPAW